VVSNDKWLNKTDNKSIDPESAFKAMQKQLIEKSHPFLGPNQNIQNTKNNIQKMIAYKRKQHGTDLFSSNNNPMKIASKNKTHHWMGKNNPTNKELKEGIFYSKRKNSFELIKQARKKEIERGTHQFLKENGGSELSRQQNLKRLAEGIHPSQIRWKCEHCDTEGSGLGNFKRWHGNNCRNNQE
jgi:hypothetical protein